MQLGQRVFETLCRRDEGTLLAPLSKLKQVAQIWPQSCLQVQCIMYKPEDWSPESDDEDFVLESQQCFVSGISRGPPDEFDVFDLTPIRHGVRNTMIDNDNELVRTRTF